MGRESVKSFLRQCIEYADKSIQRKQKRGDEEEVIQAWETYRDFTAHALKEVEDGELDHWFLPTLLKDEMNSHDLTEMDHGTRAKWLTGLISPRPLVMISTRDEDGVENIAPYSSVSVVSNTPPLAIVSFSKSRDGIARDTALNLKSTGVCELQVLGSTRDAARDIDTSARRTENSEWIEINHKAPVHPLTQAVLHCRCVDWIALPYEATAELAVLEITSIDCALNEPPMEGLEVLCQHGMDRITPAPAEWHHIIEER